MDAVEMGRYVTGLIFTLGLIFAAWYLFRRFAPGFARNAPGPGKTLHIIESLYLDPRRRLTIVGTGTAEHVILLGLDGETLIESRSPTPRAENMAQPPKDAEKT